MKLIRKGYTYTNPTTNETKTYFDFYLRFENKDGSYFDLPLSTNYNSPKLKKTAYKTLMRNSTED